MSLTTYLIGRKLHYVCIKFTIAHQQAIFYLVAPEIVGLLPENWSSFRERIID